ncbi:hypothetical protein FRB90_000704 [Tulasnella sp. 427]|nr:hypothetical protein FRB90_000704 [Tulasnella sp. 427]
MPTNLTSKTLSALTNDINNTSTNQYPFDPELHDSIRKYGLYQQPTRVRPEHPDFAMFETELECLNKIAPALSFSTELLQLNAWIEAKDAIVHDQYVNHAFLCGMKGNRVHRLDDPFPSLPSPGAPDVPLPGAIPIINWSQMESDPDTAPLGAGASNT